MTCPAIDFESRNIRASIKSEWIAALDRRPGWIDLPRSYRLLNAVLHALYGPSIPAPLRSVSNGFTLDRVHDPGRATLIVIDLLDELVDEPRLDWMRSQLERVASMELL